ncbi:MAG: xanthine dehydrogenase family protein subunit M [Chloroflexi bacterium]|nr:xanthine dehydrogenase family protein subunit M [Chloroflexota bacterium]
MIPARFDYYAPTSLPEVLTLLQQHGPEAKLLAGGHSLIPLMKLRLVTPAVLIDLGRLPGLREIRLEGDALSIGALCTHAQIAASSLVRERVPVLAETAGQVGDPQVRNRGTIGGSLAHADPAADYPAVVLALEAELVAVGPNGQRTIPATSFFLAPLTTALQPDEVLTEVRVPALPARAGSSYAKLENRASRYAVVGVAAVLARANGTAELARIGVTGAGSVAVRAAAAEAALVGKPIDEATIAAAAELVPQAVDVVGDLHASAEYRTAMLKVYARRALTAALAAAR